MFIDFCQPDPFCGLYCTSIGFTAGILSAQQCYIRVQLIPVYSAGAALGQTIEPVNRFFTAENTKAQPDLECLVGLDSATVSEVYKVLRTCCHKVSIIYWESGLTFFYEVRCDQAWNISIQYNRKTANSFHGANYISEHDRRLRTIK